MACKTVVNLVRPKFEKGASDRNSPTGYSIVYRTITLETVKLVNGDTTPRSRSPAETQKVSLQTYLPSLAEADSHTKKGRESGDYSTK